MPTIILEIPQSYIKGMIYCLSQKSKLSFFFCLLNPKIEKMYSENIEYFRNRIMNIIILK